MRWPWRKHKRVVAAGIAGTIPARATLPQGEMPQGIELIDTDTGKVYPMVPVFRGVEEGTTYWAAVLHPDVEGDVILPRGHFELNIDQGAQDSVVVAAFQQYVRVARHDEIGQVS